MSKGSIPEILKYRVKMDLDRLPGELGWSTELFANFLLGLAFPEAKDRTPLVFSEIEGALRDCLRRPGRDLAWGAHGVEEGIDPARAEQMVDKFNDGSLLVVRAGGSRCGAGAASAAGASDAPWQRGIDLRALARPRGLVGCVAVAGRAAAGAITRSE